MEIRTKDKIFLAVFLPVAIIGAYAYLWRMDAAKSIASLADSHANLVAVEDFPMEERIRKARLSEAEQELELERALPLAEQKVVADAAASVAMREREVMKVFADAGLAVMRCDATSENHADASAAALSATGLCPAPVRRRYTLDGTYPAVKRALDAFCRARMAVIPESLVMRPSGFARWALEISL